MLARSILLFTVGLASILVGFAILVRDAKRITNMAFFGISFFAGIWSIGIGGFLLASDAMDSVWWAKIYYCAPLYLVASAILFSNVFPSGLRVKKNISLSIIIPLLILSLLILTNKNFLVLGIAQHPWGKEVLLNKSGYALYSLYLILSFLVSLGIIFQKASTEKGIYRIQANLMFKGLGAASAIGVLFNLILPWFGNYQLIWIGPLATNIFIYSNAYGIIRHRMFDLHFFAVRATGYLFTLFILSVMYVAPAVFILTIVIMRLPFMWPRFIAAVIVGTFVAVSYEGLRRWFDKTTRQVFFRDDYDSAALIGELNKVLVSTMDLNAMLRESADLIAKNMKADFCLFALNETTNAEQRLIGSTFKNIPDSYMKGTKKAASAVHAKVIVADYLEDDQRDLKSMLMHNDIAVLVRLANSTDDSPDGLGHMYLGFKKSGNAYNSKDIKTIETLADVLTIAVQNSLHFEEIQNFNINLQQRVEDRTRQLQKTNEKLKALDETKDDFISMASHQLRTPLTSVKGYLSMVLEGDAGKVTPLQRKMLNQAFMSSQHMVFLIADLLNVSRLKTGKFVIEPVRLNLANMIQEEIGQLHETAKNRSLTLVYDKPKVFPDMMLDETKTRQVIMNFIDNAIHYTQAGGHVYVELYDKPQTVELRVRDDGIGVPKSEQPHLFTKFYRAVNARRERPDGTGLGLFMAKKVIVAQGGAVLFESKENSGSTFGFSLPKAKLLAPAVK